MTDQQAFERAQRETTPDGDVSPYQGMWIAVRTSRVIASAPDPVTLRQDPAVHAEDALMAVPAHDTLIV